MIIIVNGAGGRLGQEVIKAAKSAGHSVVAVDKMGVSPEATTYRDLADYTGEADVVIDFSSHLATEELTSYVVKRNLPLVLATTGQTPEEKEMVFAAAKKVPLFFSANMSLGVALLISLVKKAASLLPEDDIEIVETHHNRKLDAPSGTALALAEAIQSVRPGAELHRGRDGFGKRTKSEIGIHAIRMGNLAGEHEILIGTNNQTITLKHETHSRALFAEGALAAAEFLMKQGPGLYDMKSLLAE